jgi:uncharacterized protein YjiS (DUF1127 family)
MRYSTQSQFEVRSSAAESFGRIGRQSFAAVSVTPVPPSANDAIFATRPDAFELQAAARANRTRAMADALVAGYGALADRLSRLRAAYLQHSEARATDRALRGLDARMLRDIGLDRSEIGSIAAEAAGLAAFSRIQLLQSRAGR